MIVNLSAGPVNPGLTEPVVSILLGKATSSETENWGVPIMV